MKSVKCHEINPKWAPFPLGKQSLFRMWHIGAKIRKLQNLMKFGKRSAQESGRTRSAKAGGGGGANLRAARGNSRGDKGRESSASQPSSESIVAQSKKR